MDLIEKEAQILVRRVLISMNSSTRQEQHDDCDHMHTLCELYYINVFFETNEETQI